MTSAVAPVETAVPRTPPGVHPVTAFVRGHVPLLDGVRGLAVLLLLAHQLVLDVLPDDGVPASARLLERLLQPGWIGVQMFFVLSGFLITGVLLDSKGKGGYFRSFYGRRVLRIFPLYYFVLAMLTFGWPHLDRVPAPLRGGTTALAWIYLSNWTDAVPAPMGHFWSLALEEQFYLVWPFVVAALSARRLLGFCLALAALALGFRVGVRALGFAPEIAYENTLARMDALSLGAAAAVLLRDPAAVARLAGKLRPALIVATLALAASAAFGLARTGAVTQIAGYSLLAIVFTLLIAVGVIEEAAGGGRMSAVLSARPLRLFGKYSYAIYIFHLPVHLFVSRVLLADVVAYRGGGRYVIVQLAYSIAMTGALLGIAMLSYHLFEKRFLSLKRYFSLQNREAVPEHPFDAPSAATEPAEGAPQRLLRLLRQAREREQARRARLPGTKAQALGEVRAGVGVVVAVQQRLAQEALGFGEQLVDHPLRQIDPGAIAFDDGADRAQEVLGHLHPP
jgi:peptidoglycan/LPS O-acetylase OafA/YrhL